MPYSCTRLVRRVDGVYNLQYISIIQQNVMTKTGNAKRYEELGYLVHSELLATIRFLQEVTWHKIENTNNNNEGGI